jgi:hypothetical protein
MEYWTILWINVLGGPMDGAASGLIYENLAKCEASIPAVVAAIDGQYDYNIACMETETLSASIRPRPRPEGLGE